MNRGNGRKCVLSYPGLATRANFFKEGARSGQFNMLVEVSSYCEAGRCIP